MFTGEVQFEYGSESFSTIHFLHIIIKYLQDLIQHNNLY